MSGSAFLEYASASNKLLYIVVFCYLLKLNAL
nr:unnamed protein product [Callosobruchus analis]